MTDHDDPNYAWVVLPEDVASQFAELLDNIVDHKKDTTRDINRLADWIDKYGAERYKEGVQNQVKWQREAKAHG